MTAAQNTVALKRSSWLVGLLAATLTALLVAVIAIAISARPLVAPATTTVAKPYVQSLHDKHLNLAPTITGIDQAQIYAQSLNEKHYQAMTDDARVPVAAPVPAAISGAASVVTITGAQQAEAYLQFLLNRHNEGMGAQSLLNKQLQPRVPAPPYPDQVDPIVRHPGGPFRAQ